MGELSLLAGARRILQHDARHRSDWRDRSNLFPLPEPDLYSILPEPILDILLGRWASPKDATEQHLLAPANTEVYEQLGSHGTIVFMRAATDLTYATDRKLVDHCVKEMARVLRRHIAKGLRIYIQQSPYQAVDPTYDNGKCQAREHRRSQCKRPAGSSCRRPYKFL